MIWIVFSGDNYYPLGGDEDCIIVTNDEKEAREQFDSYGDTSYTWARLVKIEDPDAPIFEVVAEKKPS